MSDDPIVKLLHAWKDVVTSSVDSTFAWCTALKATMGRGGRPFTAYVGQCRLTHRGPGVVRLHLAPQPQTTPIPKISQLVPGEAQFRQPGQVRPPPTVTDHGNGIYEVDIGALPRGAWLCVLADAAGAELGAAIVYVDDLRQGR